MKKNKKAFTLIEVVVATSILMISVFGVYKLIGENSKLINNNDNYLQLHSLFPALKSCMNNLGYSTLTGSIGVKKYYNFENLSMTGCVSSNTSTGIILDNLEYSLSSKVLSGTTSFIDFELTVSGEGIGSYTGSYKLLK